MTPDEFAQRMKEIANRGIDGDQETDHIDADDLLCEALTELGYEEGITAYNSISKWFA